MKKLMLAVVAAGFTGAQQPDDSNEQQDVYYTNYTEARAARAAPICQSEPSCRTKLDGDGVACE